MASEDQDILAKISQLAGQINRHKNGQHPDPQTQFVPQPRTNSYAGRNAIAEPDEHTLTFTPASTGWQPNRGGYSSRGYMRGGRPPQVHRNRTLVLNGNNASKAPTNDLIPNDENGSLAAVNNTTTEPAWVTKTDRHLQLINASIFQKDSQQRAKAMEETRQQKLRHRDEREKAKFNKHLHREGGNGYNGSSSHTNGTTGTYEINVQGIRFRVAKNGSKLVKVPGEEILTPTTCTNAGLGRSVRDLRYPGDLNAAKSTPKTTLVGGVRFYRSKSGNMYRSGIVKAHRYECPRIDPERIAISHYGADIHGDRKTGLVKKINEPCKMFTTTGSCTKGPRCRYIHDPTKVAICKEFLQKGSCPSGDSCDLSHELTPERTPTCLHFAKGNCSNPNCRYSHVRVSPTALVCRPFAIYGYCEKGSSCEERHVHECPDFSNTGTCTTKGCKLPHRHKASVMRNNNTRSDQPAEDENSDVSSDEEEEEEIGSDDVDSDDLDEELFGDEDGTIDSDIPMQQDYVQLS